MSPTGLAVIVGLNLMGAATPGPDIILITRMATMSRRHAWAATLGVQSGVILWCTLTVFGAAALLTAFPWTLAAIQLVGGAYLVWMGVANVRQGVASVGHPPVDDAEGSGRLGSVRRSFFMGLSTNLANPKIAVALSAMIAPLLPAHPSVGTAVVVILALWASSFALFGLLAQVVSTHSVRRRLLRAGPLIDVGAGVFFAVVGVLLITRGLPPLPEAVVKPARRALIPYS
ncbi:LysE family translocator [Corynebacterium capitovis]|uniref:LysE family translocator n=1 Tax=Corynebacterium capitovis TaxID=131081 RepID=UPI0006863FD4|nr:LysE family translocator [Corynebacterium capitovis]